MTAPILQWLDDQLKRAERRSRLHAVGYDDSDIVILRAEWLDPLGDDFGTVMEAAKLGTPTDEMFEHIAAARRVCRGSDRRISEGDALGVVVRLRALGVSYERAAAIIVQVADLTRGCP